MGINKFIYLLLICSILVLFYKKDKRIIIQKTEEKPEISFYNSTAYDITTSGVIQVARLNEAYVYKNREEFVKGTIISKNNTHNSTNIVSGDHFMKIKNQLYIDGNVNLQLEHGINIMTEQLEYNTKSKIAKNNLPFEATQYNHIFNGTDLYLDIYNKYMKANDIKMKIEVTNE